MAGISKAERERRAAEFKPTPGAKSFAQAAEMNNRVWNQEQDALIARAEFLAVAAGAVGTVWRELQDKSAAKVTAFQAVDAILAEADRRWPR